MGEILALYYYQTRANLLIVAVSFWKTRVLRNYWQGQGDKTGVVAGVVAADVGEEVVVGVVAAGAVVDFGLAVAEAAVDAAAVIGDVAETEVLADFGVVLVGVLLVVRMTEKNQVSLVAYQVRSYTWAYAFR